MFSCLLRPVGVQVIVRLLTVRSRVEAFAEDDRDRRFGETKQCGDKMIGGNHRHQTSPFSRAWRHSRKRSSIAPSSSSAK